MEVSEFAPTEATGDSVQCPVATSRERLLVNPRLCFGSIDGTFRLKADSDRNGIAYRDRSGGYADFHALRDTWATFLQRNGVFQRFAMQLMRHSDINLTSKVYVDETQLHIYESIKNLPRLIGHTQIRAQISGAEGQNRSHAVATDVAGETQESPMIGGVCRPLAVVDEGKKMERAKGFEPSTFTLAR